MLYYFCLAESTTIFEENAQYCLATQDGICNSLSATSCDFSMNYQVNLQPTYSIQRSVSTNLWNHISHWYLRYRWCRDLQANDLVPHSFVAFVCEKCWFELVRRQKTQIASYKVYFLLRGGKEKYRDSEWWQPGQTWSMNRFAVWQTPADRKGIFHAATTSRLHQRLSDLHVEKFLIAILGTGVLGRIPSSRISSSRRLKSSLLEFVKCRK